MRLLLLVAAFVTIAAPAFAQTTGLPDPTFGTAGSVTLDPSGTLTSGAADVAVLPDGRILLAGRDAADAVVIRLTAAGALDATFGTAGIVRVPLTGPRAVFTHLALLPDGSAVAVGATQDESDAPTGAAVVKLRPDGALDAAFGTGGIVREATAVASLFRMLLVQPDGRLVGVGQFEDAATGDSRFIAVRYLASGARDAAFGTGGLSAPAAIETSGDAAALDAQGRIVVAGITGVAGGLFDSEIRTARLTPAGALDTAFGTGGRTTIAVGAVGQAAAFALAATPNPFGTATAVTLTLDAAGAARVSVFDALGRRVAVLHDGPLAAGPQAFRLDGAGLAPGVYVVRAEGARGAASVRLVRR